jgi:hypothetical protein
MHADNWPATVSSSWVPIQPQQQGDGQPVSLQCTEFVEYMTVLLWKPLRWQHDLLMACCICCKTLYMNTCCGLQREALTPSCVLSHLDTQHSNAMKSTSCSSQRQCAAANTSATCACSQCAHAHAMPQWLQPCSDIPQLAMWHRP